jgi:chorismate dehydratase
MTASSDFFPLRVGRIPFLVCAPYFHASLQGFPGASFTDGPPRALNILLAQGLVDCAPSSSFEYARNAGDYLLLPGLCTSGRGEVKSVLLFSETPWETLAGKSIELSPDSDTSNALVRVMSRFHFGVEPVFVEAGGTPIPAARIAIGDAALRESALGRWPHRYDLAQVWQAWQGAPLPLGIWILRARTWEADPETVRGYHAHLNRSLLDFFASPEECLRRWEAAFGLPLTMEKALDFFSTADYVLTAGHEQSLRTFFDLCTRAGLVAEAPSLRYADI